MGLFSDEVVETDEMTILTEIRKEVKRGVGLKKIRQLKEIVRYSIGIQAGKTMAKMKINTLMDLIHSPS